MFSAINLTLYITKIDIVKYSKLHSRALTCFSLMHNNIEVVTRVKLKKPWLAQLEVIKCQTDINCSHSLKQTFGHYSSIKKKKKGSVFCFQRKQSLPLWIHFSLGSLFCLRNGWETNFETVRIGIIGHRDAVTETMQSQGVKQTQTEREEREAPRYVKKVGLTSSLTVCLKDHKSTGK